MRILIEGHHYNAELVSEALDGVIDYFESIEREVVVNYVGYLYNPRIKDCVFILPKVLVDRNGLAFSHLAPEELIELEKAKGLTEEERRFIYEFAVWIYRALCVYKDSNKDSDIIFHKQMTQVGGSKRHIANTYLEVLMALLDFNRKHQNFFMTLLYC